MHIHRAQRCGNKTGNQTMQKGKCNSFKRRFSRQKKVFKIHYRVQANIFPLHYPTAKLMKITVLYAILSLSAHYFLYNTFILWYVFRGFVLNFMFSQPLTSAFFFKSFGFPSRMFPHGAAYEAQWFRTLPACPHKSASFFLCCTGHISHQRTNTQKWADDEAYRQPTFLFSERRNQIRTPTSSPNKGDT